MQNSLTSLVALLCAVQFATRGTRFHFVNKHVYIYYIYIIQRTYLAPLIKGSANYNP